MNRIHYDISDILQSIEKSQDGVGKDISLYKIYDDIKNARFEEDSYVSQGVWERKLKKADWELTEKLCVTAIKTQSKDFQILGWLIEAKVMLDGFDGVLHGIKFFNEFVKSFWTTGYPKDEEQKLRISDWIFETIAKKVKLLPIIKGDNSFNLYQYEYAVNLKNIALKSPSSAAEIFEGAKKSGHITLEEIEKKIKSISSDDVSQICNKIQAIKNAKSELDKTYTSSDAFGELIQNLNKIEQIICYQHCEIVNETQQTVNALSTRDNIYHSISELSKQLSSIEKHSPSTFMLDMVVSWKDKNLLQIIDDLKSGTSEAHKLLKQLIDV